MKRREFIKKSALTTAGSLVAPYILPSGRLFAPTGNRSSQHVILVMFAGGVRHQESVGMTYLDGSQIGDPYAGNIMYNMLTGDAPTMKIAYGTGEGGINPIPQLDYFVNNGSLQSQGTLFREVEALSSGHFGGLNSIIQGADIAGQGLKQRPLFPTIFEYLRRHGGYKATDTWFVSNTIDSSMPLLNYSGNPDYGIRYGSNFIAPTVTFDAPGFTHLSNAKIYHPENELSPMYAMKNFLDNTFAQYGGALNSLGNTEEEKQMIKEFIKEMYQKVQNGTVMLPPVTDNGDAYAIGFAAEVLKAFKPAFMCVNLSNVDVCHSNFTSYVKALHRADHSVGFLWDAIQNDPDLAGNTDIICIPECGRNSTPNSIVDENTWKAYDHNGDDNNSYRIWSLMAGPSFPQNLVVGSEGNAVGKVTDAMLTVADLLGVKDEVVNADLIHSSSQSFLDQI